MLTINAILCFINIFTILSITPTCSGFFLNWGNQDQNHPQYYYHQRLLQSPVTYSLVGNEPSLAPPTTQSVPVSIPSVPIQVPLQAQLAPSEAVQHVQLVPCLCPVSQEFDYEKYQQESVFNKPVNQHKNHKN